MGTRFEFQAKEMKLSIPASIKIYINGFLGRKAFFRRFCAESGIDLPLNPRKKVILPERYLIKDNAAIIYMGTIRDKAIVDAYSDFYDKYSALADYLVGTQNEINAQSEYLKNEEERLKDVGTKLAKEKNPMQKIFLESKKHEAEVRIKNQKIKLAGMESDFKVFKRLEAQNSATWKHQLTLIQNSIEASIEKYLKNLGKKVIKKLDYNDFKYINPGHTDEVLEILGGRKNASS